MYLSKRCKSTAYFRGAKKNRPAAATASLAIASAAASEATLPWDLLSIGRTGACFSNVFFDVGLDTTWTLPDCARTTRTGMDKDANAL